MKCKNFSPKFWLGPFFSQFQIFELIRTLTLSYTFIVLVSNYFKKDFPPKIA